MPTNLTKTPDDFAVCNSLALTTAKYIGAACLFGSLVVLLELLLDNFDGITSKIALLALLICSFLISKLDLKIRKVAKKSANDRMLISSALVNFERIFKRAACLYILNAKFSTKNLNKLIEIVNASIDALFKSVLKAVAVTLTPKFFSAPGYRRA